MLGANLGLLLYGDVSVMYCSLLENGKLVCNINTSMQFTMYCNFEFCKNDYFSYKNCNIFFLTFVKAQ